MIDIGDRLVGDISEFAGQVVELRITARAEPPAGIHRIGDIRFSSEPLPPPELAIERMEEGAVKLIWDRGVLQHSSDLVSWRDMPKAGSPYTPDRASRDGYFRLRY